MSWFISRSVCLTPTVVCVIFSPHNEYLFMLILFAIFVCSRYAFLWMLNTNQQLQSLEDLTRSQFNYVPLHCLEKYSSLFSATASTTCTSSSSSCANYNNASDGNHHGGESKDRHKQTYSSLDTRKHETKETENVFTFTGMNIKDTMNRRKQGLFHEYLAENEMYRIQQESRQLGFMQSLEAEKQLLHAEASMFQEVAALKTQMVDFSNDLDLLLGAGLCGSESITSGKESSSNRKLSIEIQPVRFLNT